MKKCLLSVFLLLVLVCSLGSIAWAENYDFANMTLSELESVKTQINKEIEANHSTSSSERSAIDGVAKGYIESQYGKDNVEWAWIDYTYTKDWDFYTLKTHADIKDHGSTASRYDIYCELYKTGTSYELVYVQVGNVELLNNRTAITDHRILIMLGLETEAAIENVEVEPEEASAENTAAESAQAIVQEDSTEKPIEFQPIKLWDESSETEAQETPTTQAVSTPAPTPETTPAPTPTPTTTPTPTPVPTEAPIAKKGDSNSTVKEIQNMLKKLGYLSTTPDGNFGDNTMNAVKKFQKAYGLEETGIITQSAYDALKKEAAKIPEPEKIIYVQAADLYNAFSSNEISAEATYVDKTVQVQGTVDSVKKGWFGTYYVELRADDWGFTTVPCYFDDASAIMNLSEGRWITIKGKCSYSLSMVSVHNCVIVG